MRLQRGFTLLELLVVFAIGAMLVALVPPAFDRLRDVSQYRDTVRAVVVELKQARQQALSYGQPVVFQIDLSTRQFGIQSQAVKNVPPSLQIKTTVGRDESIDNTQQASITFTPDGGSTGGTIELVRASGAGVRIRVDWLLGQITQEPRQP
jgi:general secretion pathway protein H